MKKLFIILICCSGSYVHAQEVEQDSTKNYKKRVLESTEIDLLMSMYSQDGQHSAVGGGIGSESLTDYTPTFVVSIPLSADNVLTVDAGISAYTSASSSNINPFYDAVINNGVIQTGASRRGAAGPQSPASGITDDDDDDDEYYNGNIGNGTPVGTPWMASTGASRSDALASLNVSYSHSSDDRNDIVSVNASVSSEYDYRSVGFGASYTKLFNQQNTELSLKGSAFLDQWLVIYPTELHEYQRYGSNFLNRGYFNGVDVYDHNGAVAQNAYNPSNFNAVEGSNRNSYTVSLGFSQILTRNLQMSIFLDVIRQEGLLSTPYQRVYFADRANYFVGQAEDIPMYTTRQNDGVFHLADDIERLPGTRMKVPLGMRLNYYVNQSISLRTYYRYYQDDWGLSASTASLEVPIKLGRKFTVYPSYRFYTQIQADYFAPYDTHLSTETYYTSDYDLSTFTSSGTGFGISYTDIFTSLKIFKFGIKRVDLRYQNYSRSDGLRSNIVSFGLNFVAN